MNNSSRQEINAKILYWGIPGAGKRANLNFIYSKLRSDHRGDLQELQLEGVTYDVLPIELGQVHGLATRFQIYALPGGNSEASIRDLLARDAVAIVFVVDSQAGRIGDNIALYNEMVKLLERAGVEPTSFPILVQYNRRDDPTAVPLAELQKKINRLNFPHFEAIASRGDGVLQTLTTASKGVMKYLRMGGSPLKPALSAQASAPSSPSITVAPSPNTLQARIRLPSGVNPQDVGVRISVEQDGNQLSIQILFDR